MAQVGKYLYMKLSLVYMVVDIRKSLGDMAAVRLWGASRCGLGHSGITSNASQAN